LELLDADIVPLGRDQYGRVRSGKLHAKACIEPVRVQVFDELAAGEIEASSKYIGEALLDAHTVGIQDMFLCLVEISFNCSCHPSVLQAKSLILRSISGVEYERVGVGLRVDAKFFDDCEPQCLTLI
jgi:hypothetical protein